MVCIVLWVVLDLHCISFWLSSKLTLGKDFTRKGTRVRFIMDHPCLCVILPILVICCWDSILDKSNLWVDLFCLTVWGYTVHYHGEMMEAGIVRWMVTLGLLSRKRNIVLFAFYFFYSVQDSNSWNGVAHRVFSHPSLPSLDTAS